MPLRWLDIVAPDKGLTTEGLRRSESMAAGFVLPDQRVAAGILDGPPELYGIVKGYAATTSVTDSEGLADSAPDTTVPPVSFIRELTPPSDGIVTAGVVGRFGFETSLPDSTYAIATGLGDMAMPLTPVAPRTYQLINATGVAVPDDNLGLTDVLPRPELGQTIEDPEGLTDQIMAEWSPPDENDNLGLHDGAPYTRATTSLVTTAVGSITFPAPEYLAGDFLIVFAIIDGAAVLSIDTTSLNFAAVTYNSNTVGGDTLGTCVMDTAVAASSTDTVTVSGLAGTRVELVAVSIGACSGYQSGGGAGGPASSFGTTAVNTGFPDSYSLAAISWSTGLVCAWSSGVTNPDAIELYRSGPNSLYNGILVTALKNYGNGLVSTGNASTTNLVAYRTSQIQLFPLYRTFPALQQGGEIIDVGAVIDDNEGLTDVIDTSERGEVFDDVEGLTDVMTPLAEPPVIDDNEQLTDGGVFVRAVGTATTKAAGSAVFPFAINGVSGAREGDVLILAFNVGARGSGDPDPVCSGWTLINHGSIGARVNYVYAKVATASEPTSYIFTASGAVGNAAQAAPIVAYGGADPASLGAGFSGGSASTAFGSATISNRSVGDLVVFVGAASGGTTTWTATPTPLTQRYAAWQSNAMGLAYADGIATANGDFAYTDATLALARVWVAQQITLHPYTQSLVVDVGINPDDDHEGLTDAIDVTERGAAFDDPEGLSDEIVSDVEAVIGDDEGLADELVSDAGVTLDDDEGLTDEIDTTERGAVFDDAEGLSDEIAVSIEAVLSDVEGLMDTIETLWGLTLDDDEGLTDSVASDAGATIDDQLGLTDDLTFVIGIATMGCAVLTITAPSASADFTAASATVSFSAPSASLTFEECV